MKSLLKEATRRSLHAVERPFDATKAYVKRRLKLYGPIRVLPFRGFGTPTQCVALGRVLEDRDATAATEDAPWWKNVATTIRRFRTDEVPHCRLEGRFLGDVREVHTDGEGYFRIVFAPRRDVPRDRLWHDASFRLRDDVTGGDDVTAVGEVLVPSEQAGFGVISDVDDTIVKSSASDAVQLARMTLTNNAWTRTPVPGAAALYRALQEGTGRSPSNPIFYVSSSAWNLYELFDRFMELHGFPRGPILLRDLGIDHMKLLKSGHDHKLEKVREIMGYYPDLPFVLIGDSGQRDAWLYADVVREFPGRVAAVYVHDVKASRRDDVEALAGEVSAAGVDMLLIEDAAAAARHAASAGLVRETAVGEVAAGA